MMGFCNQSVAERILSVPPLMYMFDPVAAVHRSSSAHASQSIRRLLVGKPSLLASSIRSPIGVRLGERQIPVGPSRRKAALQGSARFFGSWKLKAENPGSHQGSGSPPQHRPMIGGIDKKVPG